MIKIENMKQIEDVAWQQKALQSRLNNPGKYTAIGENVEETIKSLMNWLNTNVAYRIEKPKPVKRETKKKAITRQDTWPPEVRYLIHKHGLSYYAAEDLAEEVRREIRELGINATYKDRTAVLAEFGVPNRMLIYFTD